MEQPVSLEQLAAVLGEAAAAGKRIHLAGAASKHGMAGPEPEADLEVTTSSLGRVVQYDPRDLTISVEAGLPFAELSRVLAEERQMIPLDPPFFARATVGGVVAANGSGPRRRLYGTARDMIIGMKLVTLEGKIVQTGGMVVKNVAGLDIAKVMVGSFGTLAALGVVNFRVFPCPAATRTFVARLDSAPEAFAARDSLLRGVLQPAAVDLLNPAGARRIGQDGYLLLVQAGGSRTVLDRYRRELAGAQVIEDEAETDLWRRIREFVPDFVSERAEGVVIRASCTLSGLGELVESSAVPALARAGSGVAYLCFQDVPAASGWMKAADERGRKYVVEFAPASRKRDLVLWPNPGDDFVIMEKLKEMLDPGRLLNRGRLYGRI